MMMMIKEEETKVCENDLQRNINPQLEGLGVAFFATGPGLGLIMYIDTQIS